MLLLTLNHIVICICCLLYIQICSLKLKVINLFADEANVAKQLRQSEKRFSVFE